MSAAHTVFVAALISLAIARPALAQSSDRFSGVFVGVEGGAVSHNTHITFDGVDDPAGRGSAGFGAFVGYNHTSRRWLIGGEFLVTGASDPDPYTFDPTVVGFSEFEVRRGVVVSLAFRTGYLVSRQILVYGSVGYAAFTQSVYVDGRPLEEFAGGVTDHRVRGIQFGAGLEASVHPRVGLRVAVRWLAGQELHASDLGTIPEDALLTRFDVTPSQQQIFAGLTIRF